MLYGYGSCGLQRVSLLRLARFTVVAMRRGKTLCEAERGTTSRAGLTNSLVSSAIPTAWPIKPDEVFPLKSHAESVCNAQGERVCGARLQLRAKSR